MGKLTCPVCGNPSIEDYHHNNVVCTVCGSDLSIFNTLQKEKKRKLSGVILSLAGLLVIIALATFLTGSIVNKRNANAIAEKEAAISQLQNDINDLKSAVAVNSESDNTGLSTEGSFIYIIRRGDSFCGLSRRFYGTERYYKELAEDNGLDAKSHLRVGQKLVIKSR